MIAKIKRKVLSILFKEIDFVPIKIDGQILKLDYQNKSFWKRVETGSWEPETFEVLSKFLKPTSFYCDIGAWIGPTVTYASKKCNRVVCFEPDPFAYKALISNIHKNNLDNVSSFNVGLSNETAVLKMSSFGGKLGDSMTSLLKNSDLNDKPSKEFDAFILDWSYAVKTFKLENLDMIKIDVEGAEFTLIPAMEKYLKIYKPIVWLSFHTPFLEESKRDQSLQRIIDILSIYKKCYNSKLEQVDINELMHKKNKNGYPAFLFTD